MINLSPFEPRHAKQRAKNEARRLIEDPIELKTFLGIIPEYLTSIPDKIQAEIGKHVSDLLKIFGPDYDFDKAKELISLEALLYLVDPFDAIRDCYGVEGFKDDIEVIRSAHEKVFAS